LNFLMHLSGSRPPGDRASIRHPARGLRKTTLAGAREICRSRGGGSTIASAWMMRY
jgi:hypothetical protein